MYEKNPVPHTEISVQAHDYRHSLLRPRSLRPAIGGLLAIALLGACSEAPQAPNWYKQSPSATEPTVIPPSANPATTQKPTNVSVPGVLAPGNRYLGVDTSSYNLKDGSPLDANQLRSSGFGFIIARAGIGLQEDRAFMPSAAGADKAKMLFGGYYVAFHGKSINKQVDDYVNLMDESSPDTPGIGNRITALDVEPTSDNPAQSPTKEDVYAFAKRFHELAPHHTLLMYTLRGYWGDKHNKGKLGNPPLPPHTRLWWAKNQFNPQLEKSVKAQMEHNQKLGNHDTPPVLNPNLTKKDFEKGDPWLIASHVAKPVQSGYSTTDLFPVYKIGQVNNYGIRQFTTQAIVQGRRIGTNITYPMASWDDFLKSVGVNGSTNILEPKKHL